MSLILPLGWIDTWALSCVLRRQQGDLKMQESGARVRLLRDGDYSDPDLAGRWKPAANVIARVRRRLNEAKRAVPALAAYDIAAAELRQLDAGACLPWATGADEIAVHIGIVVNPNARLLVANEAAHVGVGYVWAVTATANVMRCEINPGETADIHMVVRLRAAEEEGP